MKTGVYESIENLNSELERCNDCCSGDYLSYHCPLCPVWKYKPRQKSKLLQHLLVHWRTAVQGHDGSYSVICHLQHDEVTARHYHCSTCQRLIKNKKNMLNHARTCKGSFNSLESTDVIANNIAVDHDYLQSTSMSSESQKQHLKDNGPVKKAKSKMRGDIQHHHSVMISPREGVFCVAVNRRGPAYPVHVIKRTTGAERESFCENNACIEVKDTAVRGDNIAFECIHLKSVPSAIAGNNIDLKFETLQHMTANNFITKSRYEELASWRNSATSSPLVVEIPNNAGFSHRFKYLSVYTGGQRYWSRTGRTLITIDTSRNSVSCKCSKNSRYCLHKAIGKWYMFQEMKVHVDESSDEEDMHTEEPTESNSLSAEKMKKANIEIDFKYLCTKKIPSSLPRCNSPQIPTDRKIYPKETMCNICSGNLKEEIISRRSKVVLMTRIVRNVEVYIKICPKCRTTYRYQEWDDGLFNFNNSLFVGMDVCCFLRSGIQNHVALGRSLAVLEDMLQEKLNFLEIENAYLHFEAMSDHDYDFNCVLCGYHPSILIWDTFRKARFRFAVSDLEIPSTEHDISSTVNARSFWANIERSIILTGMNKGLSREERLIPNYKKWSPWIGEKSRIGDEVFNTEFKKCTPGKVDEIDEPMPEELLCHLLLDEKVTNIRKICKEAGVRSDGSSMDMIVRLRQMSVSRSCFDKAYEKVFGCSGGWAVGCCRHGVVYAIKNLLRSESPRDYIDLERSLKYRPNISISDIAHLVATHGNNTIEHFFSPNNGRLDEVTEESIEIAKNGTFYSLPFLREKPCEEFVSCDQNCNPTTGSSEHYSLYDWFHQENSKRREEILRRCSLVKEISGMVDTQCVEQLFSSNKKDLYFLNNLLPVNHMFLFRLIYHLRNKKINLSNMSRQTSILGSTLTFNRLGQICQNYHNRSEFHEEPCNEGSIFEDPIDNTVPLFQEEKIGSPKTGQKDGISEIIIQDELVEDLKCQVDEFRALKETLTIISKDISYLSHDEVRNLQANIRYANTILFSRADQNRQNEIKVMRTPYGNFQTQGTSNYCGLCCINNALGMNGETEAISVLEMDNAADQLWLEMGHNPCYGFTTLLEPLRDREGFYSIEVIQHVFQNHGYDILPLSRSSCLHLSPEETGTSVCLQLMSEFGIVTLVVRPSRSQHWLTIKLINGTILFMDSRTRSPRVITHEELGNYILTNMELNQDGVSGAVYFVFPLQILDAPSRNRAVSKSLDEHVKETITDEHVEETITDEHVEETIIDEHVAETITDEHVAETITDEHDEETITDEHVEETIADEHVEETITDEHVEKSRIPEKQIEDKSMQKRKEYSLRVNPKQKRKRDSFIYPPQVKKSRVHCEGKEMCQNIPSNVTEYTFHGKRFSGFCDCLPVEVVDLYLCLKCRECKDKKVYFLPSKVVTSIFCSSCDSDDCCPVHASLSAVDIESYDVLIGAIHEGGCHWTLVAICPVEGKILYIDPRGETEPTKHLYKQQWLNYLTDRYNKDIGNYLGENWNVSSIGHQKQSDSNSSGVLILKFADSLLSKSEHFLFGFSNEDIKTFRMQIGQYLVKCNESIKDLASVPQDEQNSCVMKILGNLSGIQIVCDDEDSENAKDDSLLSCLFQKEIRPEMFPNSLADNDYETLKDYLYTIMDCENIQCKHDCHKRHHEFIANPLNVSNKERNNAGFGCDVHQYETIKYLEVKMNVDLVHYSINPSKPYQFKKGVIKNLKNEKLLKILRTFWVIHSYISGVLIKESLIFLLMKKSGKIYNECDELCKSSEVNKTEELRKRKK